MRNYTPLLKERWDKGWPAFTEYYGTDYSDKENERDFVIYLKERYGGGRNALNFEESVYFLYTPVPEEVACMALKMLSEERRRIKKIGNYTIIRRFEVDYQYNLNELDVSFRGEYVINIAWSNGEHVQNITDEGKNIDTIFGKHNIFDISGYYEARNFGFTWHKE